MSLHHTIQLLFSQAAGQVISFSKILATFLKGTGISCSHLFSKACTHFNLIVNLADVARPGFRSRMLWWAVTGSPSDELEGITSEVNMPVLSSS